MPEEEKKEWGWIGYHRTLWVSEEKGRLYEGTLQTSEVEGYTEVRVLFWAKHPVKKLREACAEKRTVDELIAFMQEGVIEEAITDVAGKVS